ncbi:hypothetical protein ACU60T_24095 [Klebsiella aerogenes]
MAGRRSKTHDTRRALISFAETYGFPFSNHIERKSFFPEDHPR